MTWQEYFQTNNLRVAETDALLADGASWRSLQTAVAGGLLVRARRGHYLLPDSDRHTLEAVRVGGRLACISAAADYEVFALDTTFTHVHVAQNASRLRAPQDRLRRLNEQNRDGVELHWDELLDPSAGTDYRIGLIDAMIQILRCQQPRFALASLDNALRKKLLSPNDVPLIFARLPLELQYLKGYVDARSDSGQETVLRFIVREAGYDFEIQVSIDDVGRVDLVVEGCLVVEADSREFHEGWAAQVRDRIRDRNLAAQQYMSYRALYSDIMFNPERVLAAIRGLLAANRNYRTIIL
ncbi:endonuclease domain-containing protein [Leifsonia sp. YAF41]|uniref:endonuclease domain-containing protein n=1 Tax=Leifsonia sp. YAF41 TaxID=3233086 RepID=UPI003F967DCC